MALSPLSPESQPIFVPCDVVGGDWQERLASSAPATMRLLQIVKARLAEPQVVQCEGFLVVQRRPSLLALLV